MYNRPLTKDGSEDVRYPENWQRLRWFIFKRDNYTCQYCGRTNLRHPNCHHIRPLGYGGNNHSSNLITVCDRCHKELHMRKRI